MSQSEFRTTAEIERDIVAKLKTTDVLTPGHIKALQADISDWIKEGEAASMSQTINGTLGPETIGNALLIINCDTTIHQDSLLKLQAANISDRFLPAFVEHGGDDFINLRNEAINLYATANRAPQDTVYQILTDPEGIPTGEQGQFFQDCLKTKGYFPQEVPSNGVTSGPTTSNAIANYLNDNPDVLNDIPIQTLKNILDPGKNIPAEAIEKLKENAANAPGFINKVQDALGADNSAGGEVVTLQVGLEALGFQSNHPANAPYFDGKEGQNLTAAIDDFKDWSAEHGNTPTTQQAFANANGPGGDMSSQNQQVFTVSATPDPPKPL